MTKKDKHGNQGVYYRNQDYAGFWRRALAWVVDLAFLFSTLGVFWYLNFYFLGDSVPAVRISFFGSLLGAYSYLALLKSSRVKTLGFRAANVKIVDLHGNKPSWFTMLVRFVLLAVGPFSFFIDLLWLTGEPTKQTLRDKFIGTYVVRADSMPEGTGMLRNVSLTFLGYHLDFKEVVIDTRLEKLESVSPEPI